MNATPEERNVTTPETAARLPRDVQRQDSELSAAPTPDPFDPAKLRLPQDFGAMLAVKKALLTVPVRKPSREMWVRTCQREDYRIQTGLLELKEDREIYLVAPSLWPELSTESTFGPRLLITTLNRQGVLFLWPIRLPGPDGKIDTWNQSALEAAKLAMGKWVRVAANMSLGAYDVFEAVGGLPEPEWPELPFRDILQLAFKDRFIESLSHPVLQRLRGEI